MKRNWIRRGVCALCGMALVAGLGQVQAAAVLQIDANGILTGATGVDVGGSLFDVEFRDGTCQALFSGCDALQDYDFQSQAAAKAASQALLDQVFKNVDAGHLFDSNPALTRGCGSQLDCVVLTPFLPPGISVQSAIANNYATEALDGIGQIGVQFYADLSEVPQYVFALWQPSAAVAPEPGRVPEPGTLALFAAALGLMACTPRRRAA